LKTVDDWAIYDGRQTPALLLDQGTNTPPDTIMEHSGRYRSADPEPARIEPLDDPDFIGAEAALKRAAEKAIARARAAGLEPVVAPTAETSTREA
jgi:hypothetical protein